MTRSAIVACCFTVLLTSGARSDAQTVTMWRNVSALSVPRAAHVAVALADGRVLVAGGTDNTNDQEEFAWATAELFDPLTETWSPAAPMGTRRIWASAVRLPNGRVLVAGGQHSYGQVFHDTAEVYDPVANTWSYTGTMTIQRAYATATLLGDGRVLLAGGLVPYDGTGRLVATAAAEVYDFQTDTWSAVSPMAVPRGSFTATRLNDGRVLVVGGTTNDGAVPPNSLVTSTAEIFNPATNTWSAAASLPGPRQEAGAAPLPDGRVLVMGGYAEAAREALLYDPAANAWSYAAPMPTSRLIPSPTPLADGRVLVVGGEVLNDLPGVPQPEPTGDVYDPATNTWTKAGTMFDSPWYPPITLMADGRVLVTGGCCRLDPTVSLASVQLYGPAACPADVTNDLNIFRSVFVAFGQTAFQFQLVLIGNRTTENITGPLAYRIDDLTAAYAATATTTRCQPLGLRRPYFRIDTGADNILSPGEYRLALLWFYHTVDLPITYTPGVLAGLPVR
jgi:N-acetylneuraminic acid mutarotase